jgi:hypothetical protein
MALEIWHKRQGGAGMRASARMVLLLALILTSSVAIAADALTHKQIRQIIIQQSINSYLGNCPCPYNTDRAGKHCGGRSAYSRAGGYSPVCFESDISDVQVSEYRQRHQLKKL